MSIPVLWKNCIFQNIFCLIVSEKANKNHKDLLVIVCFMIQQIIQTWV